LAGLQKTGRKENGKRKSLLLENGEGAFVTIAISVIERNGGESSLATAYPLYHCRQRKHAVGPGKGIHLAPEQALRNRGG
jgi:hypothetical protein